MYAYIALFALLAGRLASTPIAPEGEHRVYAGREEHDRHHGMSTELRGHEPSVTHKTWFTPSFGPISEHVRPSITSSVLAHDPEARSEHRSKHKHSHPTGLFGPYPDPAHIRPKVYTSMMVHDMQARSEHQGEHRNSQPLSDSPMHRPPHRHTDPYEITITVKTTEVPHRASRPHWVNPTPGRPTTHSHSRHRLHTPVLPSYHTPSTHDSHSPSTHREHSSSPHEASPWTPHSSSEHGSLISILPSHLHSTQRSHHGSLISILPGHLHSTQRSHHGSLISILPSNSHSTHHSQSPSTHHSSSHHGLLSSLLPHSSSEKTKSSTYTPGITIVPVNPSTHHSHPPSQRKKESTSISNTIIVPVSPSQHHSHPSSEKPKDPTTKAGTTIVPVSSSPHPSHHSSSLRRNNPSAPLSPLPKSSPKTTSKSSPKPTGTKDGFIGRSV